MILHNWSLNSPNNQGQLLINLLIFLNNPKSGQSQVYINIRSEPWISYFNNFHKKIIMCWTFKSFKIISQITDSKIVLMNRRQLKMDLRREKDNNLSLGVEKYHKLLTNQVITNHNKNKVQKMSIIYKYLRNSKISKE